MSFSWQSYSISQGATPQKFDVIINELMIDPTPTVGLPNFEFIELYNRSDKTFDMSQFMYSSGGAAKALPSYTLQPGEYLLVCDDANEISLSAYGDVIVLSTFPALSNNGDVATLWSVDGTIIHELSYSKSTYKDTQRDDGGYTLELTNPEAICLDQLAWQASQSSIGGTPGKVNSVFDSEFVVIPDVEQVVLLSEKTVEIVFTSSISTPISELLSFIKINPSVAIDNIILNQNKSYILEFEEALDQSIIYTIAIESGIEDCLQNIIANSRSFQIAIPSPVMQGDLLVNEVLFNPESGGSDYIELANVSGKILSLNTLIIENKVASSNFRIGVSNDYLLFPDSIVVLTEDRLDIMDRYAVGRPNALLKSDLPSLGNDSGNITLISINDGIEEIIDELDYDKNFHSPFIDDENGVSLERIDLNAPTNDPGNWHSAASTVGFGTPTTINSQRIAPAVTNDQVFLSSSTFSPDGDGFEDFAAILFNEIGTGKFANIAIYDIKGRKIRDLRKNTLLASNDIVQWDGLNLDNQRARIGVYVIFIEVFDASGIQMKYKLPIALSAKF